METIVHQQSRGPNLAVLALIFAILFNVGLSFVISFTGSVYYPGPWEPINTITSYFHNQRIDVLMCSFFQFGAAIPLAIFTATSAQRLKELNVTTPGVNIAFVGGLFTALNLMLSASILWVMAYPPVSENEIMITPLYYLVYMVGGVGYSVPLGLLIAGLSLTTGITRIIPRWLMWSGLAIALAGETSSLSMIFPDLLPLIPLTRFPGFVWLILFGIKIHRVHQNKNPL